MQPDSSKAGEPVTVFDPHDLFNLLTPVIEQVNNERQAIDESDVSDAEASGLSVLSAALSHAILLGFLVNAIRRESGVTAADVEHRFRLAAILSRHGNGARDRKERNR